MLDKLHCIGDKILIKPTTPSQKTKGGLLLPPGYAEKEEIQSGYIVKVGPGYPVSSDVEDAEPWKQSEANAVKYIPLQAKVGDLAIFLQKGAIEIMYKNEKYFVVPQHSILLIERDESLFE